jgi:hypothetical protein
MGRDSLAEGEQGGAVWAGTPSPVIGGTSPVPTGEGDREAVEGALGPFAYARRARRRRLDGACDGAIPIPAPIARRLASEIDFPSGRSPVAADVEHPLLRIAMVGAVVDDRMMCAKT